METALMEAAMSAIATAYGTKAADISIDQIRNWFNHATQSVETSSDVTVARIDELAETVVNSGSTVFDAEITRKNLARWFEIPFEEFGQTPAEQLEPEVLIRHLILENQFQEWLTEWGYDVVMGEDLEGKEGIDFTPDVYGRLNTLHGNFEICENFVCDQPPS